MTRRTAGVLHSSMVSPTDRFGQPVNGSPTSDRMSPNSAATDETEATTSAGASTVTAVELQRLLHQNCVVDHKQELVVGSDHCRQLCLGTVQQTVQRRSVTQEVHLVANGLKPVKGSATKFSVNKIYESHPIGYSQSESVIEFTKCGQSADDYPISSEANVVATGRNSRLYVKDSERITCIRPADGFVMIESDLVVIDLDDHQVYSRHTRGHLFLVGRSNHLLVLDRTDRKQAILVVGSGGLTIHSLSQSLMSSHKSGDIFEDRPIRLVGASFRRQSFNGQQSSKTKCCDSKRCRPDNELDTETKKQKSGHTSTNGRLVDVEHS